MFIIIIIIINWQNMTIQLALGFWVGPVTFEGPLDMWLFRVPWTCGFWGSLGPVASEALLDLTTERPLNLWLFESFGPCVSWKSTGPVFSEGPLDMCLWRSISEGSSEGPLGLWLMTVHWTLDMGLL